MPTHRSDREPVVVAEGDTYTATVTRRFRERHPERTKATNRRNSAVRTKAATWVRRNRPDIWAQLWAEVEAEHPLPEGEDS